MIRTHLYGTRVPAYLRMHPQPPVYLGELYALFMVRQSFVELNRKVGGIIVIRVLFNSHHYSYRNAS